MPRSRTITLTMPACTCACSIPVIANIPSPAPTIVVKDLLTLLPFELIDDVASRLRPDTDLRSLSRVSRSFNRIVKSLTNDLRFARRNLLAIVDLPAVAVVCAKPEMDAAAAASASGDDTSGNPLPPPTPSPSSPIAAPMTPHDVLLGLPVDLSWRSLPRTYATSLLLLTGITPRSIATLGGGSNWTNAAWNARILLATERISESCLSVVRAAVGGIVVEGRRRGGRGLQHVEVDWFFLLRWAAANDAAELIEALIGATESDPGLVPLSKPINIPSTFTMPDDIIAPSTSDVLPRALEDAFLTSVYLNRPRVAGYFLHSRPALISPACDDQRAIKMAASHGHVEITRMLVDDERVDLFSDRCYALRWATSKRFDGIKGMLEKGMRERRERAAAMNASAIVV